MISSSLLFIPSNVSLQEIAPQITHLGIGAHQDDLEIMALHGILECYQNPTHHFGGITCTSGSGSPRTGPYANYSDDAMKTCRQEEQRQAAILGEYGFLAQLDFSSSDIHDREKKQLVDTLEKLLLALQPTVIYTHHPLDKHPTHRGVCAAVIEALRRLPQENQPIQLFGGEVWRGLDWLAEKDKIALDVSAHPELSKKLISIFDSQIAGGKRYDLATEGRMRANATYATAHCVDQASLVSYAIDLMPLLKNDQLSLQEFALGFVDRFRKEIQEEGRN